MVPRPAYFTKPGETSWRQSCDREVMYVRNAVGVCDVSTLGKIDIKGPDAAKLLDLAYTNMFSTLKLGRVRYGLMLRDDGHVMDDGTTARMGENHYVMTTTTAGAGQVMSHLEYLTQVVAPHFDVQLTSVTEHWAQFSVAGPKSRELINQVVSEEVTNETFPFMACGEVNVLGQAGRLFRISFSGEQAYEIAVPARYGEALYRELVKRCEALGGGAYGLEALNVLRIEKGFITHAEIDGRVTAFDLTMQGLVSKKKTCWGKPCSEREGLHDPVPRASGWPEAGQRGRRDQRRCASVQRRRNGRTCERSGLGGLGGAFADPWPYDRPWPAEKRPRAHGRNRAPCGPHPRCRHPVRSGVACVPRSRRRKTPWLS